MKPTRPVLALLVPALGSGCLALAEGKWPLANVELSPGHGFSLRVDLFCELSCGISYRVWQPDGDLAPWSLLGFTAEDPGDIDWDLRVDPKERWAGLVNSQFSHYVLALHDFETGFDWPSCEGLPSQACDMKALEGLSALQQPGGKAHILATQGLGCSLRTLERHARLAFDIALLPPLGRALDDGLDLARARLVASVACEDTVEEWIRVARSTGIAELRRAVKLADDGVTKDVERQVLARYVHAIEVAERLVGQMSAADRS